MVSVSVGNRGIYIMFRQRQMSDDVLQGNVAMLMRKGCCFDICNPVFMQ